MSLDDELIFKGEIAKACGETQGGIHHFGDVSRNLKKYFTPIFTFFYRRSYLRQTI